ncbi:hypothetical protein ACIPPJ_03495 [Streptomyces sp. NPDC086091]|uniref:hypothetical protein n=1 Tax=Streptomyces sp. NPDC086091 TaxID=3365751 RepID=UPI00382E51E5
MAAAALTTGTLFAAAACSGDGEGDGSASGSRTAAPAVTAAASAAVAERPLAARTTAAASPSPSSTLSASGAKSALITEADIEDAWTQVDDAQTWKESLLVGKVDTAQFVTAKTDAADCQRLLDGLYDEDLLGKPSGASALTGFEEGESRLLYQVAGYRQADLDKSMDWLEELPDTCAQFTATGDDGDRTVQVVEASLPKEGDGRRGLTVTVKGETNGEPVTLTLDVAVVQVGTSDAITVTNGGLDGADHDSTEQAVEQGTPRLKDVLAGRTPKATPNSLD